MNLIDKEQLEKLIKNSINATECLEKLNKQKTASNYSKIKNLIVKYNLDISHFISKSEQLKRKNNIDGKYDLKNILCVNSKSNNLYLKQKLYKAGLKSPICEECGQDENWRKKKISLHLDHINGINNDNRLENLRILCPNCHAATDNFCGKNKLKYKEKQLIKQDKEQQTIDKQKNLIYQIQSSSIDFTKHGWRLELSKLMNWSPQYCGSFIKNHIPELWKKCKKHK